MRGKRSRDHPQYPAPEEVATIEQRSAKPPSPVRIRAAPLTDRTRINPTGSDKTPSFTGSNPSSPKVHPTPSSRQDATKSDSIRPPRATRGATRSCQPHVAMDPDLAAVVDAWPDLPEAIKAGILAMVRTASR